MFAFKSIFATLAFQLLSSGKHINTFLVQENPFFGVIKSFFFNEYSKTHLSQLHKQREFQSTEIVLQKPSRK
jgi:hypothetical protein